PAGVHDAANLEQHVEGTRQTGRCRQLAQDLVRLEIKHVGRPQSYCRLAESAVFEFHLPAQESFIGVLKKKDKDGIPNRNLVAMLQILRSEERRVGRECKYM